MSNVEYPDSVKEVFDFIISLLYEGTPEDVAKISPKYFIVCFMYAMHTKQYEHALFFASIIENPNAKTSYGIPIAEAIKHKQQRIFLALTEDKPTKPYVDINDIDGTPLLTLSVQSGNYVIFGKVLAEEPNIFAEDKDGVSCLDHIIKATKTNKDIADVFQSYLDGLIQDKFIKAVDRCDLKTLKEIIPTYNHLISQNNLFKAIKFFIVSRYTKNISYGLVQYLFKYLDEPDALDEDGFNILHYACMKNRFELIELLLNQGASPLVKDVQGALPYQILASLGFVNSAKEVKSITDKYIDKS